MERCESRVIEPEIMINAGAFVVLTAGAESKRRKRLGAEIRPGSERILWEHERFDWLPPKRERIPDAQIELLNSSHPVLL